MDQHVSWLDTVICHCNDTIIDYHKDFAILVCFLQEEYKNAVMNNVWHKRLEFPDGETIVMHNPNVIVHFQPSSQPDEWGNVQVNVSVFFFALNASALRHGIPYAITCWTVTRWTNESLQFHVKTVCVKDVLHNLVHGIINSYSFWFIWVVCHNKNYPSST